MEEMPTAEKVVTEAQAGRGSEAIADAARIRDPSLRAQSYERTARVSVKEDPSIASDAVAKMLETADKLDAYRQSQFYRSAIDLQLRLGDAASARRTTEKGLAVAARIYREDSNSDDPNTVLKAFWPSTNAYCGLLRLAGRISPPWAMTLLKEIDDPELKVAAETALVGALLDVPIGSSLVMVNKKTGYSRRLSRDPS